MSTKSKDGLEYILQAINNIVNPKVETLKYDKTYRAKVIEQIEAGVYKIQINNIEYKLNYNGTLDIGDVVRVKAPLNNFSDIYVETIPSSGGSGGTSDYNDLTNKPILNTSNSISLTPSSSESIKNTISLHKISKTGSYSDLNNIPSDIVQDNNYVHTDNNFTNILKNKLNGIQAGAQQNIIESIERNGVTLTVNNKTVDIDVPTDLSDLNNDVGFISNTVNNLTNYYLKTETYSKTEVNDLISTVGGLKFEVVESLPTVNISTTTIYLVPKSSIETENIYNEYIYVNSEWELIGSTNIDLSNYYDKSEIDSLLTAKQATLVSGSNIKTLNNTSLLGSGNINITIPTKTSELTNDSNFLTTIPIASSTTLGAIKVGSNLEISSDGTLSTVGFLESLPIGGITLYGGETEPDGFLFCDGSSLLISNYQDLYNIIGTTYGQVDSTHFNLPNLKGRVPVGLNSSDSDFSVIGETGGAKTHTLTTNELPSHNHNMSKRYAKQADLIFGYPDAIHYSGSWYDAYGTVSTANVGGGQAHNNLQPYLTLNYIIRYSQSSAVVATVIDNLTSTSSSDALSANQGKVLNNLITTNYYTKNEIDSDILTLDESIQKISQRKQLFSGSVSAANTITINTTWESLGKFKNLLIEIYRSNINGRAFIVLPYELMSTGSNLYSGRRNTNIYGGVYIYDGFLSIHNIPYYDIGTNTIKFDSYSNNIVSIYVEY